MAPKKRTSSTTSPATTTQKRKKSAYLVQWARCTNIERLDWNQVWGGNVDWITGDISEVNGSINEHLQDVVADGMGNEGVFQSLDAALQARDNTLRAKIREVREAVRSELGLSAARWKKIFQTDWIVELSDSKELSDDLGMEYKGPREPTPHQESAWIWANETQMKFKDAKHNADDEKQAHYELLWGSLDGIETKEQGIAKVEVDDMIACCEGIETRLRCWVEEVPLN